MDWEVLKKRSGFYLFGLLAIASIFFCRNNIFFWDTIQLGSKHGHFFYERHFSSLILPNEIDSGHPPFFGLYLATCWNIFGKTLEVSHFSMLPFLFGIVFFTHRLALHLNVAPWFLLLLLFADPVLAAQSILISPDLVLCCFFLMGVYGILTQKLVFKTVAIIGLGIISMRGMMTGFALFLFEQSYCRKNVLQTLKAYLPGGLIAMSYLVYHFSKTGWIGYHADSPWAPSFSLVSFSGLIKNMAILGWRFGDFGRWLPLIILVFLILKNRASTKSPFFSLSLWLMLTLLPSLLLHQYLSAHRYLLPIFLSLNLLLLHLIQAAFLKYKYLIFPIIVTSFVTGNLWIYPEHIAQGWDATLAHLPYYPLRSKMFSEIEKIKIPLEKIGTAFPEAGALKYKDLSTSKAMLIEKDLKSQDYILYSNIMNDFTDEEISTLKQDWTPIIQLQKHGITFILFHKSPPNPKTQILTPNSQNLNPKSQILNPKTQNPNP